MKKRWAILLVLIMALSFSYMHSNKGLVADEYNPKIHSIEMSA